MKLLLPLFVLVEAKLNDFFKDETLVPTKFKVFNNSIIDNDKQLNLVIHSNFKDGYSTVYEYGTNKPYYKLSKSFSKKFNTNVRELKRIDGSVVSNLRTNFTFFMRSKLYAGNDTSVFVARFARKVSIKTKIIFFVKDQVSNHSTYMYVVRDKLNDGAKITIEPDNVPILVGRIKFGTINTKRISQSEFILSVGKGFDSAIMVNAVAAFASSFDKRFDNY